MKKIVTVTIIIAIGAYWFLNKDRNQSAPKAQSPKNSKKKQSKAVADQTAKQSATKTTSASDAKSPVSKPDSQKPADPEKSLNTLSDFLNYYTEPDRPKEELVEQLKNWELKPVEAVQANQYTGSMSIIRTRKTLPGTRYFHAQYFDGNLQHMSFEFQKGPGAMDKAIKAVETSFGIKGKPTSDRANFKSWSTKEGYVVWIKKMEESDLKDDPFNAYTKEDVGTIRVAIELEIHGSEEEGGHSNIHDEHIEHNP